MDEHSIEPFITSRNNRPVADLCGLSPNEMHGLIYDPFGKGTVVELRDEIELAALDQMPILKLTIAYLNILQRDKFVKLTASGALPRKIVKELYDLRHWPVEFIDSGVINIRVEENFMVGAITRRVCEMAGLVKKADNKLSLTKKGLGLLQNNNQHQIFALFFSAFVKKLNWGVNDRYTEAPVGQIGTPFVLYLLGRYGEQERPASFYAEKYYKAIPVFSVAFQDRPYSPKEKQMINCFNHRVISRFTDLFGFTTSRPDGQLLDLKPDLVKTAPLLSSVFKIEKD